MIKYALLSAVIGSITLFGTNANAQVNNLHNDKPNETNVLSKVNTDLENATEPKVYVIDDNGDKIYFLVNPKVAVDTDLSAQPIRSAKTEVIRDPALKPE